MILPLIAQNDTSLLNLMHVAAVAQTYDDDGKLKEIILTMASGEQKTFTGEEARIVNGELHFALSVYRNFQAGINAAANGSPLVVPATLGPTGH